MANIRDKIRKFMRDNETSTKWYRKYFNYLCFGALLLLLGVLYYLKSRVYDRQYAVLLHQKDEKEQLAKKAKVDAQLVTLDDEKNSHIAKADELQKQADELSKQLDTLKKEQEQSRKQLDALSSWDDIDKYLGRK